MVLSRSYYTLKCFGKDAYYESIIPSRASNGVYNKSIKVEFGDTTSSISLPSMTQITMANEEISFTSIYNDSVHFFQNEQEASEFIKSIGKDILYRDVMFKNMERVEALSK